MSDDDERKSGGGAKRRFTMERIYDAPIEDVWALWTTKDGFESWWGPDGFSAKVSRLELRPGGVLDYAMSATAPEPIAFMKQAGLPLTTETRMAFTEVAAPHRLAFTQRIDFVPGVAPYDVATTVDLHVTGQGVRMVVAVDGMHDETWTKRAAAGWESQLGKLARAIAAIGPRASR